MNRAKIKYLILVSIAVSTLYALDLYAEEDAGLFFSLLTRNPPESSLIVTDPLGRKTGVNLLLGSIKDAAAYVNQIPDSHAGYEASPMNSETGGASDTGNISVQIFKNVATGKYNVSIFGSTTTIYNLNIDLRNSLGQFMDSSSVFGWVDAGGMVQYDVLLDPNPGAPAPVVLKTVTFGMIRQDLIVAQSLNQIGEDKFVTSLSKTVNLAEKLAGVCDKRKHRKDKPCQPAIAVLKLFIKRLEIANRKCDSSDNCGEESEWAAFHKEHGKDHDYDDFFREWDRDDWHKHKKGCKRFVSDEALKIIKDDTSWLIKSLGGETDKDREGHHDRQEGKKHD